VEAPALRQFSDVDRSLQIEPMRYQERPKGLRDLGRQHRCGDLNAGVEGPVVWIACECGARMARLADANDRTCAGTPETADCAPLWLPCLVHDQAARATADAQVARQGATLTLAI
jgi:hypothetical protein